MELSKYIGQKIVGDVIDYNHLGQGIVKHDNIVVFVDNVKLNQKVKIEIIDNQKSFLIGKIENPEDLIKSDVFCDKYYQCGGCDIMHLSYDEQLDFKEKVIINSLRKYDIDYEAIKLYSNPDQRNGYRNKSRYFMRDNKRALYAKNTKELVAIDYCYLQSKEVNNIIDFIYNSIPKDLINNSENIQGIEMKSTYDYKQVMIIFHCQNKIKVSQMFIDELTSAFPVVKSINIHRNKINKKIYGVDYLKEKISDKYYLIGAESFFQINPIQAQKMIEIVNELTDFSNKKVLDAYCGSGFFSIAFAEKAKSVIGIELNKKAIELANQNKKLNQILNIDFISGDIVKQVVKLDQENDFFDVVIVDPPRKGLAQYFIDIILEKKPKEIIYISCNIATFCRDINKLKDLYELSSISGIDMFSHTHHIEIICKLKLKEE